MHLVSEYRVKEFNNRVARLKFIQKQKLEYIHAKQPEAIHVCYLLGHVSVCGGVKIILEHANELVKNGVQVTLLSHFPKPDWFDINAQYKQIPFGIELAKGIPSNCSVIVATYWDQLSACVEACIAPVVYFEQGDFHLWDWEKVTSEKQALIYNQYQLPGYIITCSETGAQKIKEIFNREALVFHNALNELLFYPKKQEPPKNVLLAVGSENAKFKRIPDIWEACQQVRARGYDIEFKWVTQHAPTKPLGTVIVNPPQQLLGSIYREASIYVCASEYETFPLPPLEAMACGTPVITTPNDGVRAYGIDKENCLFFECSNPAQLADKIINLLESPPLYQKLQQKGYETATHFKWNQIIPALKNFYQRVAQYKPVGINDLKDWEMLMPHEFNFEEQQAIEQFLKGTSADIIYLPFTFKINHEVTVIRWLPVYQRTLAMSNQIDYFYGVSKERPLEDYPYSDAAESLVDRNYLKAIARFKEHLDDTANPQEAAVLLRWIAWCLIKANRLPEAQLLLQKGRQAFPAYTDIYYLYSLLFRQTDSVQESENIKAIVKVFGDAVEYPEFIKDISELMEMN